MLFALLRLSCYVLFILLIVNTDVPTSNDDGWDFHVSIDPYPRFEGVILEVLAGLSFLYLEVTH